jgi:hypothetical protein
MQRELWKTRCVDGQIILIGSQWDRKEWCGQGCWSVSGQRPVYNSCKHGNEPSLSKKIMRRSWVAPQLAATDEGLSSWT